MAAAIVGALVVALYAHAAGGRELSRSELDWAISTLGVFYALHLATDVRRGRTSIQPYRYDPRYDYVRSADPVGFWILIAIQGALAAATIFGYLGDLLGLWHL